MKLPFILSMTVVSKLYVTTSLLKNLNLTPSPLYTYCSIYMVDRFRRKSCISKSYYFVWETLWAENSNLHVNLSVTFRNQLILLHKKVVNIFSTSFHQKNTTLKSNLRTIYNNFFI